MSLHGYEKGETIKDESKVFELKYTHKLIHPEYIFLLMKLVATPIKKKMEDMLVR